MRVAARFEQGNGLSSWIDGSQIYDNTVANATALRSCSEINGTYVRTYVPYVRTRTTGAETLKILLFSVYMNTISVHLRVCTHYVCVEHVTTCTCNS